MAVILICIYGIIGIPKSKDELIANWNRNIKLGLDLRGGSHLVLQVQAQDAFVAEAQQVVEHLKEELSKQGVAFTSIDNTEPKTLEESDRVAINIRGVPPEKAGTLRQVVTDGWRPGTCPLPVLIHTDHEAYRRQSIFAGERCNGPLTRLRRV